MAPKNPGSAGATNGKPEKTPAAYQALAHSIKDKIASGEYAMGDRLPAETSIGRENGLSTMTVRQAIGLLVKDGLLRRIQGSGTYVAAPTWANASFGLSGLASLMEDRENISMSFLKAGLASVGPKTAAHLQLDPKSQVIRLDRLIRHKGQPILLNHSVLRFDPMAPMVETELEQISFFGVGPALAQKGIKKSQFKMAPVVLGPTEAQKLRLAEGEPTLKISYTLYDFDDSPLGLGWFLPSRKLTVVSTKMGFWDEPEP